MAQPAQTKKPNVVYFLVDNLGMGELSSYNGCSLRGTSTARIDTFAQLWMAQFILGLVGIFFTTVTVRIMLKKRALRPQESFN